MRKKVLEVTTPPITNYFNTDIPLTILYGEKETHPWIFSNYIQLYSIHNVQVTKEEQNPCFIDFHHSYNGAFRFLELQTCPWILFERISRKDIITKWGDVLSFAKEKIMENRYLGITVEQSKIKNYAEVQGLHNLFLYGFDEDTSKLYTADHFKDGMFSFETVTYDEFKESVLYSMELDLNWGNLEGICLFSKIKRTHENLYQFEMRTIVAELKQYLLMEGLGLKNDRYYIFGIKCYDNLIEYYKLVADCGTECILKAIHCQRMHKRMMVLRIEFLLEFYPDLVYLLKPFQELEREINIILSLTLKYNVKRDVEILMSCIQKLSIVKEEEGNLTRLLLADLMSYS